MLSHSSLLLNLMINPLFLIAFPVTIASYSIGTRLSHDLSIVSLTEVINDSYESLPLAASHSISVINLSAYHLSIAFY